MFTPSLHHLFPVLNFTYTDWTLWGIYKNYRNER
nr:MAG TPA: Putative transcription factor, TRANSCRIPTION.7A [Caudoviricetes sp.]